MTKEIKDVTGIDLSMYNTSFVERIINGQMSETQSRSFEEYVENLKNIGSQTDQLKRALHNTFSEFFRNTLTFSFLEHILLPQLAERKSRTRNREIRIWSAACAAGQEAYSTAMVCKEFATQKHSGLRFRIFATDLSDLEIQKAQKGIYAEEALKNVSYDRIKNYFSQKGNSFIVHQQLKEFIDFSTFDLLNSDCDCPPASIFGNFDIVFCANLLFYYSPRVRQRILDKVDTCLAENGYLIVGEAEKEIVEKNKEYTCLQHLPVLQKRILPKKGLG